MPTIQALVDRVTSKQIPFRNGKTGTLYEVHADGKVFSSFDAAWTKRVGSVQDLTYNEVVKGDYTNYRLVDEKKPVEKVQASVGFGEAGISEHTIMLEIRDLLRDQNTLLHALAEKLAAREETFVE